jgi:aryl-alcohol dehydrogenase-like predicted oxidoreductase
METRQFGNSDMHITPIGFGAWAIGGGGWEYAWGPQDDQESIEAIHAALDKGMNWIDTAAVYGLGHSEEVVARALKGMAQKPYVFTKCALRWDADGKVFGNLKRDSLRQELEDSLRRLQTDTIDLYQIHWPDEANVDIEEAWGTLADMQREGKVRWIGVSNFDVDQLKRCQAIAPVTSLQPPYSLVKPEVGAEILPFCHAQNIGVIAYSPMYSGMLTGTMTRERVEAFPADDWRRGDEEFQEPRLTRNLALADLLKDIAAKYGRSAAEASVAWVLVNPAVTGAIVGARRASQIDGFIGAADFALSDADMQTLHDFITNQ